MKLEIKDIQTKLNNALNFLRRYVVLVFILILCLVYGYLTVRINSLTQIEPSQEAVIEKLQTVKRPKVDEEAIKKMESLEEQNVQVQTLFQEARNNPFSE